MSVRTRLTGKKQESRRKSSFPLPSKTNHSRNCICTNNPTLNRQRLIGNRMVQCLMESGTIQAKLKIGQTGDKYEQEADRIADQVMRMPLEEAVNGHGLLIQRKPKCPECMEEEEEQLQRKEITGQTSEMTPGVESHIRHIKTGGQPLPESTRSFFEPRFGADFSHVRIHSGSEAAQAAQSVDAHAFTLDSNIVFNQNKFSPGTFGGKHLLAHELSHVIQQDHSHSNQRFRPPVDVDNTGPEPVIQRTQVARPNYQQASSAHFVYELDNVRWRYTDLEEYYGVPARIIKRHNPGKSATSLKKGQRIRVPAINPPVNLQPVSLSSIALGLTMNVKTNNLNVRWNSAPDANIVGTVPRGKYLYFIPGGGYFLPLPYLVNPRQGIIKEMEKLGLIGGGFIYCFVPGAYVRDVYAPASSADIDLMARMLWGEEKFEPEESMIAAGWTARNRYDAGWGTYSQIITEAKYHGLKLAPKSKMATLTGTYMKEWEKAQRIAKEVIEGTIPDPTGGFFYFGNEKSGTNVLKKMQECANRNTQFKFHHLSGTTLYYSNGDYTPPKGSTRPRCTVP